MGLVEKRKRGRPPLGGARQTSVRLPEDILHRIAEWRTQVTKYSPEWPDPKSIMNESDAIRLLLDVALKREELRLARLRG